MAHKDLQMRPMKIGIKSAARLMSQTGLTRIVRQRPILVVVERPLHHRSLLPKAAVRIVVSKWSSRQDTRKCTKRPSSKPAGKEWEGTLGSFSGTEATSTRTEVR